MYARVAVARGIGRRTAVAGVVLVASVALIAVPTLAVGKDEAVKAYCPAGLPDVVHDEFPQPTIIPSRDGLLATTLKMTRGRAKVNGRFYEGALTYNGTFPGPTLVMCGGDKVKVKVINGLEDPTNLHVHGLHVSPRSTTVPGPPPVVKNHDNVFLEIPGRTPLKESHLDYEYDLPVDHDAGAFWYHPHLHHHVSAQIFGGLAGAIIVKGALDKTLAGVPQRLMMIQSTELCDGDGADVKPGDGHSAPFALTTLSASDPETSGSERCDTPGEVIPKAESNERFTPLLINGTINPTVKIRPGQIQRWRIFNANNNRIVVLSLEGQPFEVLAMDGNTLRRPTRMRFLRVGPGSRREVLVRGGHPDSYRMTALPFAQFPTGGRPDTTSKNGGPTPNQTVLTVVSSGTPAHDRLPRALGGPAPEDLRDVDEKIRFRTICFAESNPNGDASAHDTLHPCKSPADDKFGARTDFKLDGKVFDTTNPPITMKRGAVEQWTLINSNTEWHTFHIHVNPFQVISINGRRVRALQYKDNVEMPPNSRVVIRMRPKDFIGKFVFHCHVTSHEDLGMMASVQVVSKPTITQRSASVATGHGYTIRSAADSARAAPASTSRAAALVPAWVCKLLGLPVTRPAGHAVHRT